MKNPITPKQQLNLLTSALEGGSNYWYELPDISTLPKKGYNPKTRQIINDEINCPGIKDCLVNRLWEAVQAGKAIPVSDIEDETHLGYITKQGLEKACELMAEKYPFHYADAVGENDDAITGDVFLQLVVMGELIYG